MAVLNSGQPLVTSPLAANATGCARSTQRRIKVVPISDDAPPSHYERRYDSRIFCPAAFEQTRSYRSCGSCFTVEPDAPDLVGPLSITAQREARSHRRLLSLILVRVPLACRYGGCWSQVLLPLALKLSAYLAELMSQLLRSDLSCTACAHDACRVIRGPKHPTDTLLDLQIAYGGA
jgi:hypothetical protein